MIAQYFSNANESATVSILYFFELNKAIVFNGQEKNKMFLMWTERNWHQNLISRLIWIIVFFRII